MSEYAALVAIDWVDQKHAVSLYDQSTGKREQTMVKHTPAALQEWALGLRQRFAAQPIAVCLEQSRGPLIYFLLQFDCFALYPINPATLAKYRQAFSTAGSKDDPSDADYLLDLLQHLAHVHAAHSGSTSRASKVPFNISIISSSLAGCSSASGPVSSPSFSPTSNSSARWRPVTS